MSHPVKPDQAYSPETLVIMSAAFDAVCNCVSKRISVNGSFRQTLALTIIRHVDEGERDPLRLSDIAFRELAGIDGPVTGGRAATQ
jgi:hypothetical protein